MKKSIHILFFLLVAFSGAVNAQTVPDSTGVDTMVTTVDSMVFDLDSMNVGQLVLDSLGQDSLLLADSTGIDPLDAVIDSLENALAARQNRLSKVKISEDGLDDKVDYSAEDSMIYDIVNQKVYLYGTAKVAYEDLTIDAAYIEFDWASNIVTAEGRRDTSGNLVGNPDFKDKTQGFQAKKMRYNFKTRKGIIYNVTTKQGNDLYVLGAKAKFFGANPTDTLSHDVVYSEDAIFTTCNHPEPHFGIRSNKQKVIPNKMVIVGPSNLEIGGVPTPLWLPFGFYPITNSGSTGLIFPRDYQSDPVLGYGLKGVGWYFPLKEQFDLELTGDIYSRGTWALRANSRYKTRYKYSGNLLLEYANQRVEDAMANVSGQERIKLQWSHRQDGKAHPYNSFNGSINIQTNGFSRNLEFNPNLRQQNSLSSNVSFSRRFARNPTFNFTASFSHSQNTKTGAVTLNLPNLRFTTGTLYPFKRKIQKGGKEQWYEKITFDYSADARNRFNATDSTLFTQRTFETAQTGMKQEVNVGANFKLFKYFNISPRASYSENWYLQAINKTFDPTVEVQFDTTYLDQDSILFNIQPDTLSYGDVTTDTLTSFGAFHNLKNLSVGMNTKIFGQMDFAKGKLRGIRHTMTPEIRFGYQPDYSTLLDSVDTDVRSEENTVQYYTRFQNGFFDKPTNSGRDMRLSFSLNNIVEAKTYSKRDSTTNVIKLLESFNLNSSYNYAADSLHFDPVAISANTNLFNRITTLRGSARYSFYALDEDNKEINEFQWDRNRRPLRFVNANLTASTRISLQQLEELFFGEAAKERTKKKKKTKSNVVGFSDILNTVKLSHDLQLSWNVIDGQDTMTINAHSLKVSISQMQLTENWSVRVDQFGYDFKNKGFLYPSLTVNRDLHCWQMSLGWYPNLGSFQFSLKVKPGTLEFIKVPYQQGQFNVPSF